MIVSFEQKLKKAITAEIDNQINKKSPKLAKYAIQLERRIPR
jgi:hypothetical protein